MSDDSMRETVAEEAAEQIDVATLISGDNIQEGVNGKEMGIALGRWAGERAGRAAGETVGMTLHEIFTSGPDHRNFWEVCVDTKQEAVSWISNRTDEGREQLEEGQERIKEGQERVKEEAEERIEEGQERIEEGQERVKEEAAEVTDDLPSLEDINREILDEMSDQDLESVAQEAGVKADQAREEMTTKILDAVPGREAGEETDDEENDDEWTEIDLSEAAMADEASEAAGPYAEQAYPAREGTDPEPTSEEAPERVGEGEPTSSQSEEYETDDKLQEDDNGPEETVEESKLTEEQQEAGNPSVMTEDPVLVPPETSDGLETLYEVGELDPEDRENAIEQATKRGFEKTVQWLEKVGDEVYAQAARGEFVAGDEI